MAGWGDFVNNTNSTAVDGSAGTKVLNSGNLTLRYESGQFFDENSSQGGQKWQELSRLAVLFNTTSLPDTLSVTGVTLSLKVESINSSGANGWDKNYKIAPYAYNPDSTSSITTAEYDNFGNISYADAISKSAFNIEQRISFTLTNLDWINADGVSKIGLRFLEDVNYDPPSFFPMQWSDVRFFDHNSTTDNRPYIDVTYEDATSYSEVFDERVGTPITTEPGTITAPTQTTTVAHSTLNISLLSYYKMDNNYTDAKGSSNGSSGTFNSDNKKLGTHSALFNNTKSNWTVASLPTGNSARSFSLWVKRIGDSNASSSEYAYYYGNDSNGQIFAFAYERGNSSYGASFYGTDLDFDVSADTNWHHWVLTYDGSGTFKAYQDATLVHTATSLSLNTATGNDLYLGGGEGGSYGGRLFKGYVDGLGIWSKELTASEVSDLYNSSSGLEYDDTLGFTTEQAGGGGSDDPQWDKVTCM